MVGLREIQKWLFCYCTDWLAGIYIALHFAKKKISNLSTHFHTHNHFPLQVTKCVFLPTYHLCPAIFDQIHCSRHSRVDSTLPTVVNRLGGMKNGFLSPSREFLAEERML